MQRPGLDSGTGTIASSPWQKCRFHDQVIKPVDVRRAGVGDASRGHIQTIASSIRGHRALRRAPSATNPEEAPHPETEIECTGVHEQSLQDVLVAVDVRATQATGFVEMRAGAFEQFAASAKEAFAARAADAPPIGIHSITFGALIDPRLSSAVDRLDGVIGDRGHRFELCRRFRERLLHRGRVALVGALHRDADNRAGLQIDRMRASTKSSKPCSRSS